MRGDSIHTYAQHKEVHSLGKVRYSVSASDGLPPPPFPRIAAINYLAFAHKGHIITPRTQYSLSGFSGFSTGVAHVASGVLGSNQPCAALKRSKLPTGNPGATSTLFAPSAALSLFLPRFSDAFSPFPFPRIAANNYLAFALKGYIITPRTQYSLSGFSGFLTGVAYVASGVLGSNQSCAALKRSKLPTGNPGATSTLFAPSAALSLFLPRFSDAFSPSPPPFPRIAAINYVPRFCTQRLYNNIMNTVLSLRVFRLPYRRSARRFGSPWVEPIMRGSETFQAS